MRGPGRAAALARFALGGVASSTVVLGTTALAREGLGLDERIAAALGLATALVVNFAVLRSFVFRGTREPLARQAAAFVVASGGFRALEYAGFLAARAWLDLHYLVALVAVLGASFCLKFVVFEGWIFARRA